MKKNPYSFKINTKREDIQDNQDNQNRQSENNSSLHYSSRTTTQPKDKTIKHLRNCSFAHRKSSVSQTTNLHQTSLSINQTQNISNLPISKLTSTSIKTTQDNHLKQSSISQQYNLLNINQYKKLIKTQGYKNKISQNQEQLGQDNPYQNQQKNQQQKQTMDNVNEINQKDKLQQQKRRVDSLINSKNNSNKKEQEKQESIESINIRIQQNTESTENNSMDQSRRLYTPHNHSYNLSKYYYLQLPTASFNNNTNNSHSIDQSDVSQEKQKDSILKSFNLGLTESKNVLTQSKLMTDQEIQLELDIEDDEDEEKIKMRELRKRLDSQFRQSKDFLLQSPISLLSKQSNKNPIFFSRQTDIIIGDSLSSKNLSFNQNNNQNKINMNSFNINNNNSFECDDKNICIELQEKERNILDQKIKKNQFNLTNQFIKEINIYSQLEYELKCQNIDDNIIEQKLLEIHEKKQNEIKNKQSIKSALLIEYQQNIREINQPDQTISIVVIDEINATNNNQNNNNNINNNSIDNKNNSFHHQYYKIDHHNHLDNSQYSNKLDNSYNGINNEVNKLYYGQNKLSNYNNKLNQYTNNIMNYQYYKKNNHQTNKTNHLGYKINHKQSQIKSDLNDINIIEQDQKQNNEQNKIYEQKQLKERQMSFKNENVTKRCSINLLKKDSNKNEILQFKKQNGYDQKLQEALNLKRQSKSLDYQFNKLNQTCNYPQNDEVKYNNNDNNECTIY